MPKIHELIDNVAIQQFETLTGQVRFSNLDLKNAHSQSKLCKKTSKQLISVLWAAKNRERIDYNRILWTGRYAQQFSMGHGLNFKEHTVFKLLYRRCPGGIEGISR